MKTYRFSLFTSVILLVLLHIPTNLAQANLEAVTLPFTQSLQIFRGDSRFFKLDVSQIPEGVDVSLSAVSSKSTAAKMYVSKHEVQQFPQSAETSDYVSTSYSGNIIFISGRDLVGVQNLYIGLVCSIAKCENDVTFEFSKEINVEANGEQMIETPGTLNGASSAVIRLKVPEAENVERIVMHIDAIPVFDTLTPPELDVFINVGNDIPFSNHAENIPRTSWFEGRTIVIHNGSQLFCTNCVYTLSLKFSPYSSISFQADTYEADLYLEGVAFLDGAEQGQYNSYYFELDETDLDEDFFIDIKPQEGTPMIYIHCDHKPENYTGYYWYYVVDKPMEIMLTPRERTFCQNGTFYILITSKESSVYSLRMATEETSRLFVGQDSAVMGDIFTNETVTYEVFLPLWVSEKMIIDLTSRQSINMSLINCRFPTDCPGLLPGDIEFRHQANNGSYQPPDFKYEVENITGGQRVTLDPHKEGCYPIIIEDDEYMKDPVPVCAYKITLFSTNLHPVEYTLKAVSEGHDWLLTGISKFSSVAVNETAYFVLFVPQEDVKQVNIQLTKFSGDFDVYVSKTEKYPRNDTDETEFSHEGMISFQNKSDLNGTYYIAVQGLETSSFSIVATVVATNGKTEDYAQTLKVGVPQKGVLLPNHELPSKFYKFDLDLDPEWKGTITISATTLRGSVLLTVNNNGEVPFPNDHMWESTNQKIEITSSDENFDFDGTYYIGVYVDWSARQPEFEDITFNIVYSIRETASEGEDEEGSIGVNVNLEHFFLSPLTPFHRTIKKNEIDFYEAFILPRDEKITLYKQADAGEVDLYVSLDSENEYPTDGNYNYSTKTTLKDSIELTADDLNKTCEGTASGFCKFFIAVIPRGDQEKVSYTLTMKRDYALSTPTSSITPIEDGRQMQLHVPSDGKPAIFYFYSVPFYSSVITVSSDDVKIQIYAKKKTVQIGSSIKPEADVPTESLYDYSSINNEVSSLGLAHLTIPAEKSINTTIVTLAVYFKNKEASDLPISSSTIFNILVSSRTTHIYTGKPYYGAVEAGKYMYFKLDIARPNSTLLISLTTLNDGDPDLVVSTSINDPPTLNNHQFASISKSKTEVLEINQLDIYPKTSMEGTWVIGVYGMTNSTFVLTVIDEEQKMVQLKANVPFDLNLRENATMYFQHYHSNDTSMEIRINQLSGNVVAYVTSIMEDDELVMRLPNKTDAKWTINPDESSALKIPKDDPKACTECLYLITLESSSYSKLSIVIAEGEKFMIIQAGTPYTGQLSGEESKMYLFNSASAEEITLSVALKGPKLNIYASHNSKLDEQDKLWEGQLTSARPNQIISLVRSELEDKLGNSQVWDGIDYVKSEKNSFYFRFDNPSHEDISYTFTVSSKDSSPILKAGYKFKMTLNASEATSMIYYASEDDEDVKLAIEFSVETNGTKNDQEFERTLKRGVPVTAKYWGERVTTGIGKEVPVVKDDIIRDSTKYNGQVRTYHFREGFTIESRKGKFSFDIENPFLTKINISATVYASEFGTLPLDQNSQHSSRLTEGMSETYEFYLGGGGYWYLWSYACSGGFLFSTYGNPDIANQRDVPATSVKYGREYLYMTRIVNEPMTLYAKFEKDLREGDSHYVLSSNFFEEDKYYTYEIGGMVPRVKASFEHEALNYKVRVSLDPVKITDYGSDDEIIYHVKVCPYRKNDADGPLNLCTIHEDCRMYQQQFKIGKEAAITTEFDRLAISRYYVHVTADIQHNQQVVKFVPYQPESVEIYRPLSEKVSSNVFVLVLTFVGLLIVAAAIYVCFIKVKKMGKDRGFELSDIGRRRGYGFVEEDDSQA